MNIFEVVDEVHRVVLHEIFHQEGFSGRTEEAHVLAVAKCIGPNRGYPASLVQRLALAKWNRCGEVRIGNAREGLIAVLHAAATAGLVVSSEHAERSGVFARAMKLGIQLGTFTHRDARHAVNMLELEGRVSVCGARLLLLEGGDEA
jgi:hypothetical protein